MTAVQVKAAQVLMAKVLPDMTAAEVTVHDPAAGRTEAELLQALSRALASLDPDTRQRLVVDGTVTPGISETSADVETSAVDSVGDGPAPPSLP